MEQEIWKQIKGYEKLYEVSNFGNIKSVEKEWILGNGARMAKEESLLIGSINKGGYRQVTLCNNSVFKYMTVHRLVAIHFCDNPNGYNVINHKNSIRTDNRAENLEWCTSQQNAIHGFKFGNRISIKGENLHQSKLTEKDVLEIRELHKTGKYVQREIASKFGIIRQQVSRIINNKDWKHI